RPRRHRSSSGGRGILPRARPRRAAIRSMLAPGPHPASLGEHAMIQKMKIAPHLFVGLGGCGSKVVNEIARKFKRRPEEYARYKRLVHFFAFDTDQHELKQAESVDVRVAISDFHKRDFVAHSFGQR